MSGIDSLTEDNLPTKQWVLRDDLKRMLIYWQLFKYSLQCLNGSDTLREWGQLAKDNGNKNYVDQRIIAGDQLRSLDAMMMKVKKGMTHHTFNAIMSTLTSEQIKEVDLLMNEITELKENAIEGITKQVKDAKIRAGIPLNSPIEQKEVETIEDLLWSCVQPAVKHLNPEDSDGYDEAEVYQALGRLYQKIKPNEKDANSALAAGDSMHGKEGEEGS